MIDHAYERLMHDVLDGTASPADAARLEAWLATSEAGRRRRDELAALFSALADVPRVPPPPALRTGVLAAIRSRPVVVPPRRRPAPAWLLVPSVAAALAVALAFPAVRHALRPGTPGDVSGALAARPATAATPVVLAIGEAGVTLERSDAGGATTVVFQAAGAAPGAIELEADPGTLARATVRGLPGGAVRGDPAGGRLTLAPGREAHFRLEFRPGLRPDETVRIVVRDGGRSVAGELPPRRAER